MGYSFGVVLKVLVGGIKFMWISMLYLPYKFYNFVLNI